MNAEVDAILLRYQRREIEASQAMRELMELGVSALVSFLCLNSISREPEQKEPTP